MAVQRQRRETTGPASGALRKVAIGQWQKLRAKIMKRDGGLCQQCLRDGHTTPATDCDHIVPLLAGGTDDESNLQALCRDCHNIKSRADRGIAPKPVIGLDGWPVG